MKYSTFTFLIAHLFLILFSVGCSSRVDNLDTADVSYSSIDTSSFFSKVEKMKKSLEGKKIVKYDLILDTAYNTLPDTHLILYFTGSDCSSCIQKAIAAIEHKNMINNHLFIVPISYQSNIGNIQMSYDYPYMIYDDNSNTIRGSLQYISTPVFIKYSIKDGIQDIYVIPTFDDNGKLSDFIESLG